MNETGNKLQELFDRIPRRHNAENVKEIYNILDEYEELLQSIESEKEYESHVPPFFDALDPIRATVKKSNDNKASKKMKDTLFDEASGNLKDTMEELIELYSNNK
jgi:signal transduction protein with GAF and PtsI domain